MSPWIPDRAFLNWKAPSALRARAFLSSDSRYLAHQLPMFNKRQRSLPHAFKWATPIQMQPLGNFRPPIWHHCEKKNARLVTQWSERQENGRKEYLMPVGRFRFPPPLQLSTPPNPTSLCSSHCLSSQHGSKLYHRLRRYISIPSREDVRDRQTSRGCA